MECLLPYLSMVGLERMLDYRGVGLEKDYRGVGLEKDYRGVRLEKDYRGVGLEKDYRGVGLARFHCTNKHTSCIFVFTNENPVTMSCAGKEARRNTAGSTSGSADMEGL